MLNDIFSIFKKDKKPQPQASVRRTHYPRIPAKAFLSGETTRSTASLDSYDYTSDELVQKFYQKLVIRSSKLCRDNPYAKGFLKQLARKVIGQNGIELISQPVDILPDNKTKPDVLASQAIELAWWDWCQSPEITGKFDWIQIQTVVLQTVAKKGECFIRIIKGKYAEPWGFGLQLIDARLIDFNKNENSVNGGNYIRFGIEYTFYGKPVAYYIKQGDYNGKHVRIPAEEILHIGLPEEFDQKRYFPWFSAVIKRAGMLGGYEEAAVEHARIGACQMGFIQKPEIEDADPEDEEPLEIEVEPGSFPELPAGYIVKEFNPAYPNGEFDTFSKAILRGFASGLGCSYNSLANDLTSVNFSSLRQGALDERDEWMMIQHWLCKSLLEPIFRQWLPYSLLYGKITMPNGKKLPAEKIEKFKAHIWQPRRWPWVDPTKDINAAIASVEAGFRSRSDVIREQGRDPEDVWLEIENETKELEQRGIRLQSNLIQEGQENAGQNQ